MTGADKTMLAKARREITRLESKLRDEPDNNPRQIRIMIAEWRTNERMINARYGQRRK